MHGRRRARRLSLATATSRRPGRCPPPVKRVMDQRPYLWALSKRAEWTCHRDRKHKPTNKLRWNKVCMRFLVRRPLATYRVLGGKGFSTKVLFVVFVRGFPRTACSWVHAHLRRSIVPLWFNFQIDLSGLATLAASFTSSTIPVVCGPVSGMTWKESQPHPHHARRLAPPSPLGSACHTGGGRGSNDCLAREAGEGSLERWINPGELVTFHLKNEHGTRKRNMLVRFSHFCAGSFLDRLAM